MGPSERGFGLSRIGQIAVTVTDLARAVDFYRDRLGLKYLFEASNLAFFDCGGIRLMLSSGEKPSECYSSIIYYRVESITEAYETLLARGVRFEGEPHLIARLPGHELWMAFFRDPDANLMGLMSEVPRA